jgi:hypothetical protein
VIGHGVEYYYAEPGGAPIVQIAMRFDDVSTALGLVVNRLGGRGLRPALAGRHLHCGGWLSL